MIKNITSKDLHLLSSFHYFPPTHISSYSLTPFHSVLSADYCGFIGYQVLFFRTRFLIPPTPLSVSRFLDLSTLFVTLTNKPPSFNHRPPSRVLKVIVDNRESVLVLRVSNAFPGREVRMASQSAEERVKEQAQQYLQMVRPYLLTLYDK